MNDMRNRLDELNEEAKNFDRAHPNFWNIFVAIARKKMTEGYKRYSAKAIFEQIRWDKRLRESHNLGVKHLQNNFTAFYARKFVKEYPEHEGFFLIKSRNSIKQPPSTAIKKGQRLQQSFEDQHSYYLFRVD